MRILFVLLAFVWLFGCADQDPAHNRIADAMTPVQDLAVMDATTPSSDLAVRDASIPVEDAQPLVPDARPPLTPNESPSEGEANQDGVSDLLAAVPMGLARAGRVDIDGERLTGPEAKCRVGDYRLDNALISVCIQAETTFSQMGSAGGNLIDAHLADRPGTDALREISPAPGLGSVTVERVGIVRDGTEGGAAIVRVEGLATGSRLIQNVLPGSFVPPAIHVTTEYRLYPDTRELEVLSWLRGRQGGLGQIDWMDLVYFGDSTRLMQPAPPAEGLHNQMPWVAAEAEFVSYGWRAEAGPFTILALPEVEVPAIPALLTSPVLREGDVFLHRRRFTVGHGDVESVRPVSDEGVMISINGGPSVRVDITDGEAMPVTRVLLNADGVGRTVLPPGSYVARTFEYPGGDVEVPIDVADTPLDIALPLPVVGRLRMALTTGDDVPIAGRVMLSGPVSHRLFVLDEDVVSLPPGRYRVVVSRGWHFSVVVDEVEVIADQEVRLDVVLTELIPTHGWTSGEFHQHSAPSLDSQVAIETRILTNLAEGVGFMVPSDHDILDDYLPFARRMGVEDRIAVPLTGIEVSPLFTHFGAYGIPHDPYANAGGAPPLSAPFDGFWMPKTVPQLFAEVQGLGARLIQINHPRSRAGYFNHVSFSPEVDLGTLDPAQFSPDFHSLEVFNSRREFCQVFTDWMGLLNQGLRITGVGNSDTHSVGSPPGYPRNYLPTAAADPALTTADEIVDAVQNGVLTVGGGAMIDFPDGPQPGDTVTAADGTVRLRVRIRTPDFVRVHRLVAFANGVAVLDLPLETEVEEIVDFDQEVDVPIGEGAHVIFLALGDDSLLYVEPGAPVFAFTNPIWVDRDGQGVPAVGPGGLSLPEMRICR